MEPTPYVQIARVVKTHGTAGEVAVSSLGGALEELPRGLEVWFVPPPQHPLAAGLEDVRRGPKGPLATFSDIRSPEQGRALTGTFVLARRADLPDDWMPEEEPDLEGFRVMDTEKGFLGRIVDTIVTGANDVWVVSGGDFGEVLIPVIDDVVLSVDDVERSVHVRLLPGLIEEG